MFICIVGYLRCAGNFILSRTIRFILFFINKRQLNPENHVRFTVLSSTLDLNCTMTFSRLLLYYLYLLFYYTEAAGCFSELFLLYVCFKAQEIQCYYYINVIYSVNTHALTLLALPFTFLKACVPTHTGSVQVTPPTPPSMRGNGNTQLLIRPYTF